MAWFSRGNKRYYSITVSRGKLRTSAPHADVRRCLHCEAYAGTIAAKGTQMTQRTPRIQITLKAEARSIFERLSAAQDRPVATIIAEFLDETAPALQNVVGVVERAKNAVSRVGKAERERFAVAEAQLLQHQHTALSALAGVDAAMGQLSLDLSRKKSAQTGGVAEPRAGSERDPPDTNRGVNTSTNKPHSGRKLTVSKPLGARRVR